MATVEVMMKMAGAAPTEAGGEPSGADTKKAAEEQAKGQKGILRRMGGGIKSLTGIQFGTAAMLKQSQIFTSTVGVIFQLMGALVDVILAPFIPIIVPAITLIAKLIPVAYKVSQAIFDVLSNTWGWFQNLFSDPIGTIKSSFIYFKDNVTDWIKDALSWGFSTKMGFITVAFTKLFAQFPALIPKLIKLIPILIKGAARVGMGILKIFAPPLYIFFKVMGKIIGGIFRVFQVAFRFFRRRFNLQTIFKGLKNTLSNFLRGIWEKLGKIISKVPMFGKVGKAISGIAKASKAIPVLGSVATLGFGAYETIQATRKYGPGAGLAYGAKTLAATGLTLAGASAAGLAVDVGGSMALNKAFGGSFLTMEVRQDTGDGTTKSREIRFVSERDLAQSEGMKVVLD